MAQRVDGYRSLLRNFVNLHGAKLASLALREGCLGDRPRSEHCVFWGNPHGHRSPARAVRCSIHTLCHSACGAVNLSARCSRIARSLYCPIALPTLLRPATHGLVALTRLGRCVRGGATVD